MAEIPKPAKRFPFRRARCLSFASNVLKSMINSGTGDNSIDGAIAHGRQRLCASVANRLGATRNHIWDGFAF